MASPKQPKESPLLVLLFLCVCMCIFVRVGARTYVWQLEDSLSIRTQFSLRQHLFLPTAAFAGYLDHHCPDILLSLSPIHSEECGDHRHWTFVSTHVHPVSLRLRGLNAGLYACLKTRSPLSHLHSNFPLLFRDSSSKSQV